MWETIAHKPRRNREASNCKRYLKLAGHFRAGELRPKSRRGLLIPHSKPPLNRPTKAHAKSQSLQREQSGTRDGTDLNRNPLITDIHDRSLKNLESAVRIESSAHPAKATTHACLPELPVGWAPNTRRLNIQENCDELVEQSLARETEKKEKEKQGITLHLNEENRRRREGEGDYIMGQERERECVCSAIYSL
jgi:hypothetical protein